MKKRYFQSCCGPSARLTILVVGIFLLSGCNQPELTSLESASSANGDNATDDLKPDDKPSAESRPPAQAEPITKTKKPAVDAAAFREAAFNGKIEMVRDAIEAGVEIDSIDEQQRTALMWAAFNGHTELAKLLLEKGAEVNRLDAGGRTALLFAATGTSGETVELLLDAGADINAVDTGEGFSALMHAAAEGQLKVVQVLLKHNADTEIRDKDGDTARDFAIQNGHVSVVQLLSK